MIYTSNFAKSGTNLKSVSIAIYAPDWYKGKVYNRLAPPKYLLNDYKNNKLTIEEYKEIYYGDVLSMLNPCQVINDIGDDVILLCWESANEFCHRFLVAEWFYKELGIEVEEYIENSFF